MKSKVFIFIIYLFIVTSSHCQNDRAGYKSFSDTTFEIGDKIIAPKVVFSLSGGSRVLNESIDSVKVIANFLKKNPQLIIEVGVHTDCRGSEIFNDTISDRRAKSVKYILVDEFYINQNRIEIKGYGEKQPLISEEKINAEISEDEKEALHRLNRRVEIKIIAK